MAECLKDFSRFLSEVIFQWSTLATGGIIVALLWLYTVIQQSSITRKVGLRFALAFLFIANFLAWKEQYDRSHTKLVINLRQDGFTESLQLTDGNSVLHTYKTTAIVIASISNLGPRRSVAVDYVLTIFVPGRKEPVTSRLLDLPATAADIHTHEDVIPIRKSLFRQTLTPIENGDKKVGFLLFVLDDDHLTIPYLARKGTRFILSCTDTDGNTVTSETQTLTGTNAGFQHDVGLER